MRLESTIKELLAQGVTVHVVSYAQMGRKNMWKSQPLLLVTGKKPRKTAADIAAEIMNPSGSQAEKPKIRIYIDTDIQMRLRRMEYLNAMKEGERWLRLFAVETGGTIFVPSSAEEMLRNVEEIAGNIDSQYVITYKPNDRLLQARRRVPAHRGSCETSRIGCFLTSPLRRTSFRRAVRVGSIDRPLSLRGFCLAIYWSPARSIERNLLFENVQPHRLAPHGV